jgi:uncharacterized membrane protein
VRALRNVAIIAVLAAPIAFVPGGGNAASAILATLTLAFLAVLGFAGRQLYRESRLTVDSLAQNERALLVGAVCLLVLMIAGASDMLNGGGPGAALWVVLVGCAVVVIASLWIRSRSA